MIDLEQFKELDPIEVSDEKMKYFSEELLKMHDELTDAWAEELKTLETEEFDPYSFFGERKSKKSLQKSMLQKLRKLICFWMLLMMKCKKEKSLRMNSDMLMAEI